MSSTLPFVRTNLHAFETLLEAIYDFCYITQREEQNKLVNSLLKAEIKGQLLTDYLEDIMKEFESNSVVKEKSEFLIGFDK